MSKKGNQDMVYNQKGGEAFGTAIFFLTAFPALCNMLLVVLLKNTLPFFMPWMILGLGAVIAMFFAGCAQECILQSAFSDSERINIRLGVQRAGRLLMGGGAWVISLLCIRVFMQWGMSVLFTSFWKENVWASLLAWLLFSLFDIIN